MSLFLTVGLFIVLPAFVIRQIDAHVSSDVLLNAIEGELKITFFIAVRCGHLADGRYPAVSSSITVPSIRRSIATRRATRSRSKGPLA